MSVVVTVRDEAMSGAAYHELPLEFPTERITVRELIRARVYQEVQDFNLKQGELVFCGLVQPSDAERVLNGSRSEYRLKQHRQLEWKPQFEKALEAFDRNGFFILMDDQQAESLDQEFVLHHQARISFVKLTPLVGG
ncbi:hypothetical protein ETAA8_40500 [Anatilimnocola aggregata]|uniref:Uncharacterized protein n=1 Tax=Anatilimnocola aggregata TaxID=2528021 RepID=A0A517YFD3_9BACT|nr:hypothetical protein [Anatilimnocola aggregata]QDU28944.1 hypothetical protein ETAA8_40500 [Anatilimnocola aggregata]